MTGVLFLRTLWEVPTSKYTVCKKKNEYKGKYIIYMCLVIKFLLILAMHAYKNDIVKNIRSNNSNNSKVQVRMRKKRKIYKQIFKVTWPTSGLF